MTAAVYADPELLTDDPRFPHPFYSRNEDQGPPPRTRAEYRMCNLSATLRDKPRWWIKFKDEAIAATWRKEAMDQGLDEKKVDYVLAELEDYAQMRDERSGAEVSCFDGIWHSDTLISDEDRAALRAAVHKLEDVPEADKDWHPDSNDQVLDLVHPSLYPLVYRRTLLAPKFEPAEVPGGGYSSYGASGSGSDNFAWLPTDFTIAPDGSSAKAQAYINNIHPSNTPLVHVIEKIVASFVPLLNRVLTDQLLDNDTNFPLRTPDHYWYDEGDCPEQESDEGDTDYDERYEKWNDSAKPLVMADTPDFKPGSRLERTETFTINGRTVQIIVKLANIHLTPEKPKYGGGTWHVEGMANENIVASGLYYYDEDNISKSHLAFRQAVSAPVSYQQSDDKGARAVWGLANEDELVQKLGSVETKAGRCVCFPNVYQHRVSPFSLDDKDRPGYRKILALFLVNPTERIISTTEVAPQQHEWAAQALNAAAHDEASHLSRLPREVIDLIASQISSTMTRDEAFEYRLELMKERAQYVVESNAEEGFFGTCFSMCEH